jgi:hypothetical protein
MPQNLYKLFLIFSVGCGIYFSAPIFYSEFLSQASEEIHCAGSYPFKKIDEQYMGTFSLKKVGSRGPHTDLPDIFIIENEKLERRQHRGWYSGKTVKDYTAHVYTSPITDMYYFVMIEDVKGCYFDFAAVNKIYWITYIGF